MSTPHHRERLVHHVQDLERLQDLKARAADNLKSGFEAAASDGFDTATLKAVLKLRKLTPSQRAERRALEAIYLAALGMLEGDPLPNEARRRLDEDGAPSSRRRPSGGGSMPAPPTDDETAPERAGVAGATTPEQPSLALKDPDEARQEGAAAAAAGKRIYDNPYPAGDPCRAAWDEGWCTRSNSHGLETPAAYRRRVEKPPDQAGKGGGGTSADDDETDATTGPDAAAGAAKKGAA